MGKIFSLILVSLLAFPMTACGRNKAGETGTAPGDTGSEPAAEGIRESCLAIPGFLKLQRCMACLPRR